MRNLNVFRLARNVDYNVKSASREAHGGGRRCPASKKPCCESSDVYSSYRAIYTRVDPDMVVEEEQSANGSGSVSAIAVNDQLKCVEDDVDKFREEGAGSESGSMSSAQGNSCAPRVPENGTQSGLQNRFPYDSSSGDSKRSNTSTEFNTVSRTHNGSSSVSNNHTPSNGTPHRSVNGFNGYVGDNGPHNVVPNGSNNGLNGRAIGQQHEPEPFRRLINEAPFMMTAHEPPLELDTIDSGIITHQSSTGQISRAPSTRSKAESRVSISTFNLELDWIDPKLIKAGRDFIRRNFLSLMFAHLVGLAFLLTVRPVAAILLRHGKFHRPAKRHNWHMYLLLFRKLKSWYESSDFTDVDDPTTAGILKIRRSMCSAAKNFRKFVPPPAQELQLTNEESQFLDATRSDLTKGLKDVPVDTKNLAKIFATVNPDVPWSQYDLAVTQFSFFGPITLFPRLFGIHDVKGIEGFVHIWAVLGHLLGLENRFNLCRPENYEEETNSKLFRDVFLFSFRISDNGSFRMCQCMCDGSNLFTIFSARIKIVYMFIVRAMAAVSTKNMNAQFKWYDTVQYVSWRFWNRWAVRVFPLRILGNLLARGVLHCAYGVLLGQLWWRNWRASRRKPQQFVPVSK